MDGYAVEQDRIRQKIPERTAHRNLYICVPSTVSYRQKKKFWKSLGQGKEIGQEILNT